MKKIVYSTAIVCLLLAAVSCKSTKASKKAKAAAEEQKTDAVVEAGENSEAAEAAEAPDGKAVENPEAADSEKTASKDGEETEDKDFTGWIKSSRKNITERFGRIQIKIKGGIGSYNISALNERDKAVPVLSTANEYVPRNAVS